MDALETIQASHDEFDHFFGDVFDQLQSLSLELFARHKCLELSAEHQAEQKAATAEHQQQFQKLLEELGRLRGEVQQAAEGQRELQAEFQTGMENVHSERVELRGMQQAIEGHMARLEALAAQLAEVHSTAAATDGDPDRQQQLHELLEDARRQKAAWEQDRCALEAEVELLRGRTVELNETLTEQRHQAAEHQAALASELKRMRSLLEAISGRMQQDGRPGADSKHIPSADEALLDSVLSQFQLLQKDVAQRRVAKHR